MDWTGMILLLTVMSTFSSVFSCPEECECYHDIHLYTANCSSFPTSNENELAKIEVLNLSPTSSLPLALKEGQFVGFKKLKYLSLSNCSIYYIHKKAFYGLKNLIEIDLSFNNIQTLDPLVFQHINDLTSLILRGNPIKFTANTPFLVSNTIQHLDLGLCNIKSIPRGVFFGVKKIMYMSLDGNRLQTLKYNSLPRGLKTLNIANNMIVNVPIELLTSLSNLRRLDLSGNPINCTCPLMDLQDWFSGRGVTFDNEVICSSPPQYAGRSWNQVNENELCITETLIENKQRKPYKKPPKYDLKSKEKYFLNEKNRYIETSALQADEPFHFINEKMDPNSEILFQNDDTLAMGEMMRDKEGETESEKPTKTDENNTGIDDTVAEEDPNKKIVFDYVDTDDKHLKEENKKDEDEFEPVNSVISTDNEANKQSEHEDDNILSSEDELDSLTETKTEVKSNEHEPQSQNDDVNSANTAQNGGEEKLNIDLTESAKGEANEKAETDNLPVVNDNVQEIKKEPIPVEEPDDEYDKLASEALLTVDKITKKEEKQDTVESKPEKETPTDTLEAKPIENIPFENEDQKESINTEDGAGVVNKVQDENISDTNTEDNKHDSSLNEEINKPKTETNEKPVEKESEQIDKEEMIPVVSNDNSKHTSRESSVDKDLLTQEDLIETFIENKDENNDNIDSTEEPVKNIDENNIDTDVIVEKTDTADEKMGQIKAIESVDANEHDIIENSDLQPEVESDVIGKTEVPVVSKQNVSESSTNQMSKDILPVVEPSGQNNNTEGKPEDGASRTEVPEINVDESKTNANESSSAVNVPVIDAPVAEDDNSGVTEENVDKSKNDYESVTDVTEIVNKITGEKRDEETTTEASIFKSEDTNILTAVEIKNEPKNESEPLKNDDHTESENHLESFAGDNLVNKSSEETTNEEAATTNPNDNNENFKSKLNEEMFMPDTLGEITTTDSDYDISTTETPLGIVPVEEPVQNKTVVETEITKEDVSQNNDSTIIGVSEIPEPTKEEETKDLEITTVSEPVVTEQNKTMYHVEFELTTNEPVPDKPEITTAINNYGMDVTPGESAPGNDTNVLLVSTDNKHNADIREGRVSDDEVLQEPEPFELQESHIVLGCILVLVVALMLFSVYKCASNKNKSSKRITTKDLESNHGTEMQDMASLLPKPTEDDNKSTKKYPDDASSNEKIKLITEEKEEDDNQYQRGKETQAVVEKENSLNNNAPNSPSKPPLNRTATPIVINPAAPIQRTKVKVAIIPESIPRTPIFVQKTYNNGVSTNG